VIKFFRSKVCKKYIRIYFNKDNIPFQSSIQDTTTTKARGRTMSCNGVLTPASIVVVTLPTFDFGFIFFFFLCSVSRICGIHIFLCLSFVMLLPANSFLFLFFFAFIIIVVVVVGRLLCPLTSPSILLFFCVVLC